MRSDRAANPYSHFVMCTVCACALFHAGCGGGGGGTSSQDGAKQARDAATHETRDAGDHVVEDAGSTKRVSFARDVRPIFQRCVICHHPGGIIGYDLVDPFDKDHGIVGRPNDWHAAHDSPLELVVKPGSPDESFLIYKVSADPATFDRANNGDPMPSQIERITPDELANIKQWISDGANNDSFFTDTVAPIFGTAITLGRRVGKCTLCHYPDSPTGMNILDPFDGKVGLVNADSLLSKKPRVMPGSPENSFLVEKIEQAMPSGGAAMPLHYDRLSNAEVDVLRAWIAQGANND